MGLIVDLLKNEGACKVPLEGPFIGELGLPKFVESPSQLALGFSRFVAFC